MESLLENPVFKMASDQLDTAADYLQLSHSTRDQVRWPKRMISVAVPVQMDSGEIKIFSGYRVQHHLALGPAKGGLRYSPDVCLGEVAALAMWMSWKCALAGLPYGGGKGGVTCDPHKMSLGEIERMTRRYTSEMIPFIGPQVDVMAPDMGTNEQTMAWMTDTYSMHAGHLVPSIVTGKPVAIGGSLGRKEATGRGVAFLTNRALDWLKVPNPHRIIVQGFGNVGSYAAYALASFGAEIVGVSDMHGGVYNAKGLDIQKLQEHADKHKTVHDFPGGQQMSNEELLLQPCEALIPAATEQVITEKNAGKLQCRILAEGANGPTTTAADKIISQRGDIFVIPDILCNSGGVIVSYFEWVQSLQNFFWNEAEVFDKLYRMLDQNFNAMVREATRRKVDNRTIALAMGIERVVQAKKLRGLFP